MVFVDDMHDLEYYHPYPDYGCYGDIVTQPGDIMLQAQLGTSYNLSSIIAPVVKVYTTDGVTLLEDASAYFNLRLLYNVIDGITYYYANLICNNYSPQMLAHICFTLRVTVPMDGSGNNYFDKFTQKYQLLNPAEVPVVGVTVTVDGSANLATLCYSQPFTNSCVPDLVQLVWQSDCTEDFNGDFYGPGTTFYTNTAAEVNFVRLTVIEGRLKKLPTNIKRTLSINCRTQRTEKTKKFLLQGKKPFPLWKMEEIEMMLLGNRIFINGVEKQSEGGTAFTQAGPPKNCVFYYKLEMDIQDCYQWQIYGCTPSCDPPIYYFPVAF